MAKTTKARTTKARTKTVKPKTETAKSKGTRATPRHRPGAVAARISRKMQTETSKKIGKAGGIDSLPRASVENFVKSIISSSPQGGDMRMSKGGLDLIMHAMRSELHGLAARVIAARNMAATKTSRAGLSRDPAVIQSRRGVTPVMVDFAAQVCDKKFIPGWTKFDSAELKQQGVQEKTRKGASKAGAQYISAAVLLRFLSLYGLVRFNDRNGIVARMRQFLEDQFTPVIRNAVLFTQNANNKTVKMAAVQHALDISGIVPSVDAC